MLNPRIAILSIAVCFLSWACAAEPSVLTPWAPTSPSRPLSVQLPDGHRYHQEPNILILSHEKEKELFQLISSIPRFSPYLYSGCHDRAHALWTMLPAEFKTATAKVWLLAPAVTTLANPAKLTIPSMGEETPQWGYHVALLYRTTNGAMVIDPAMNAQEANRPIYLKSWVDSIGTPPGTIISVIEPKWYLFYSPIDKLQNVNNASNTVLNNGEFFEYTGPSKANEYIEKSLARDDVAWELINNPQLHCPELRNLLRSPNELLVALQAQAQTESAHRLQAFFAERTAFWRRHLSSS